MGQAVALSGNDTISLNNRVFSDLATGDCAVLSFETAIADVKVGKNGNAIYTLNETGNVAKLELHVLRGSADDKYLNNLKTQQQANFASTVLNFGEFVKNIGDGKGNVTKDTYLLGGGIFVMNNDAKDNVEGDANQSVTKYTLKFSNAPRTLT